MKYIELPQFIQHNGYCHREGGRANGGGDIFQLSIPNPATSTSKRKMLCYSNPINTTLELYCENINDGIRKLKARLIKESVSIKKVDKKAFADQWGNKDFNWLSQQTD